MIYVLAAALRAYYKTALVAAGRPVFEREFTSDGAVAFDGCESLVVENSGLRTGGPTEADQGQVTVRTRLVVDMNVWAWRCVPVVAADGDPPSPAEVEASAAIILADRWALTQTALGLFTDPASPIAQCQGYAVLGVDAVGPEGGLAGTVVRLAVQL